MPHQLIAFDIGGVLADINKNALAKLLGGFHQLNNFFDLNFMNYQRGQITSHAFLKNKSQQFNLDYSTLKHTFQHMIIARMDSQLLTDLTVPYIFFSNINELHFNFFISQINTSNFALSNSLTSYKLGQLKPHRIFFDRLSQGFKLTRAEILVIDDQRRNTTAALKYGFMAAAYLNQE